MRTILLTIVLAGSALAQPISVGLKAGTPLTDFFNGVHDSNAVYVKDTKRFLIGPTVELHLPLGFSVEFDALYRSIGYSYSQGSSGAGSTSGNSWQFPLLAKKTLLPGPIKPFIDGGISFQRVSGNTTFSLFDTTNGITSLKRSDFMEGFTFGGGVQIKLLKLRIEPEFRYTRWGSDALSDPVNAVLTTNRNQGDFVVGFTF